MKKFAFYLLIAIITGGVVSCNSDSTDEPTYTSSNVAVTSFSLEENDNILENLDSVYFSIDLNKALIYNADSLPYGTDISRLVVTIVTNGCSVADLIIPRGENLSDTTINYMTNSTDSIDFSHGPVTFHLVSPDGLNQADYKISVNVHQMKPDSLYWNRLARRNLPSTFYVPAEQKTIEYNGKAVCLTRSSSEYCIATSNHPDNNEWKYASVAFGFNPNINSLNATTEALYILDTDGNLYTSTDGTKWDACNVTWHHIYGGYGSSLLGVKKQDNTYFHVTYPETTETPVASSCPVSGTSTLLTFENKWNTTPQAIFIGGECSDNRIVGSTWGYDGTTWVEISATSIPARKNMTIFPYFTYKTDSDNWNITKYTTLVAMLGVNEGGEPQKDVYISLDQGIHWKLADDLMQLPENIPAMFNAQALVYSSTLQSRSTGSVWEQFASKKLPRWWVIESNELSRATTPISEWECPYIYLFGGQNQSGTTYNTVWKGVINRLSFKPLI